MRPSCLASQFTVFLIVCLFESVMCGQMLRGLCECMRPDEGKSNISKKYSPQKKKSTVLDYKDTTLESSAGKC